MDLSQISTIISIVAGVNKAFKGKLEQNELVVRALKKLGLEPGNPPKDFDGIYTYSLVEFSAGKNESILELFRHEELKGIFHEAFEKDDFAHASQKITEFLRWNKLGDNLREFGIDALKELATFKQVFEAITQHTRTPKEVLADRKLNSLQEKIDDILKIVKPPIAQGPKYDVPKEYPSRKVYSTDEVQSDEELLFKKDYLKDLTEEIKKEPRIALLGDAGVGKTFELERVAGCFSRSDSQIYPFRIALNTYVDDAIPTLLPSGWDSVPENQLLLIFDGFDEIESKNKITAQRRIESFVAQHPACHILVSSRANFYTLESPNSPGTLAKFRSYKLSYLEGEQIEEYLCDKLGAEEEQFTEIIISVQLQDLMKIPFYLIQLVNLFKENGELPTSRSDLFEKLLNARIGIDIEHFRTTISLRDRIPKVKLLLQRLALGMETLGRNYISEEEFGRLIPEESDRQLLNYCTAWRRIERDSFSWQFEHNNFQEFLAAKVLAGLSMYTILDFIAFPKNYTKLIPSWRNTVSFLIGLVRGDELLGWVKANEPEILPSIEKDRWSDEKERTDFLKAIFNRYKEKRIYIDREKFKFRQLARFGQSKESVEFLVREAENAVHHTTLLNAIELLSDLDRDEIDEQISIVKPVLVRYAQGKDLQFKTNPEHLVEIQSRALIALADLRLQDKETVDLLVKELRPSENSYIRWGLYYLLTDSEFLDDKVEVFLEGMKFLRFKYGEDAREVRIGNESFHLKQGLEKVKSLAAIAKILIYFKEHPRDLSDAYFNDTLSKVAENAASVYNNEPDFLRLAVEFFAALLSNYLEDEAQEFLKFFDNAKKRFEAFKILFAKGINWDHAKPLTMIADRECIDFLVERYSRHDVNNEQVSAFQSYLRIINSELYPYFYERINAVSQNGFMDKPARNYEEENRKQQLDDLKILFDREEFLRQVDIIFTEIGKEEISYTDLSNLPAENGDPPGYSKSVIAELKTITRLSALTCEDILKILKTYKWDIFLVDKLKHYLEQGRIKLDDLSLEQREWIEEWCMSNVKSVDFKESMQVHPDGRVRVTWKAIVLNYFMRKLGLKCDKNVLLDMLSFYWFEGSQKINFDYLEPLLPKAEMKKRILTNLREGIASDDVLMNHLIYCKKNHLKAVLPYVRQVIIEPSRFQEVRILALECLVELSEAKHELEEILPSVLDDFKWRIIKQLVPYGSEIAHSRLLEILQNGEDPDKLQAAEYLIRLQDLRGLEFFFEWLKRHNAFTDRWFDGSPFSELRIIDAVPVLLELIKLSFTPGFRNPNYHRLDNYAWEGLIRIGLSSNENYQKVLDKVKDYITANRAEVDELNYLNVFLDQLERQYYINNSQHITIDQVIEKMNRLNL